MKVHELLSDSTKWIQNCSARNSFGAETDPSEADAVCWCLVGAVIKCYDSKLSTNYNENMYPILNIYKIIEKEIPNGYTIPYWNDLKERTYEEVYTLVKRLDI